MSQEKNGNTENKSERASARWLKEAQALRANLLRRKARDKAGSSTGARLTSTALDNPTGYIKEMIKNFQIPGKDLIDEYLFFEHGKDRFDWDSGFFVSTGQSEKFYSDIFQFWVRAFFCFVESTQTGPLFSEVTSFIECRKIESSDFTSRYNFALNRECVEKSFIEEYGDKAYVSLRERSFSDSYSILVHPRVKSWVACSGEEYVAFFCDA